MKAWKQQGSKDTFRRAGEIAQKILREHKPEPLPTNIKKDLDDVARKMMKRHGIDKLPLGPA